jgi:hypothetical protein
MRDISWQNNHDGTKDDCQKQMQRHQNRFKNKIHSGL